MVIAAVVLFDSPDFLDRLPDSARQELYAGIHRRTVTHWTDAAGRVRITLYQSPDASYILEGHWVGSDLVGEGRQRMCCGNGPPPETGFVAERVGPPDPSVCAATELDVPFVVRAAPHVPPVERSGA